MTIKKKRKKERKKEKKKRRRRSTSTVNAYIDTKAFDTHSDKFYRAGFTNFVFTRHALSCFALYFNYILESCFFQ